MARNSLLKSLVVAFLAFNHTQGQSASTTAPSTSLVTTVIGGTTLTYKPQYTLPASVQNGANVLPNIQDPQAVDAQTVCPGYKASNVVKSVAGFSADLTLAGKACNVYGTDVDYLTLEVAYLDADRLSVNIQPSNLSATNTSWYILSPSLVPIPAPEPDAEILAQDSDFQFSWTNDPTFSFSVIRRSTGDVVFSTEGSVLVYEDQFIEFVTKMPENYNVYGLGERIHGLRLGNNLTATIYAADVGDPIDSNIYGSHPVYLDTRYYEVDDKGNLTLVTSNETSSDNTYTSYSHAVWNRNAHGLEVLLRPDNITWRALGGAVDLYFFDGPTPSSAIKQYVTGAAGLPAMQQYFAFGYHQCRWGYSNWSVVEQVVQNFADFNIPLETIWTDIDYMQDYRDFQNNAIRFNYSQGQQFLAKLHANGQHYTPIVDSAIYIPNPNNASDVYPTYNRGNDSGVFLNNPDGSQYIGAVWPGFTVFPDWHAQQSVPWWTNEMAMWHNNIPWDGIWIDMSEVSSFCVGSCGSGQVNLNPVHPPFALPGEPGNLVLGYPEGFNITNATEAAAASSLSASEASAASATAAPTSSSSTTYLRTTPTPGVRNVDHPPYVINNVQGDLAVHAVAPNATHHDGVQEYDVHNLFGHQILNATYQALLQVFPGKRPFIIGRSTFTGTGKWAGHWGGDNTSLWMYMFFSIPQALSFSLFGIPMFGVDTCGFNGNSDEELCNRWMQLSAFFPFYRNHNEFAANSQEPYIWASVAEASRTAMAIRYSLLPYIYTNMYLAHTTGSTVMTALAWEFPNDPSLASADRQFLLGPSILVTPVLDQGATTVNGVFPGLKEGTVWYDWYNQTAITGVAPGQNVTIDAPLGHIPVYVRGGSVIPMQEPGYTTEASRKNPWALLVALSQEGTAAGSLYVDDGESLAPNATLNVDFAVASNALYVSSWGMYVDSNPLANITILGVASQPKNVTLNGQDVTSCASYSSSSQVVSLTGLNSLTSGGAWSSDWTLEWS